MSMMPALNRFGVSLSRGKAAVAAPAFDPASLNPYAWWDAEAISTLTLSGASVTTWADKTTGLAPTQATSGFKPLYSATSFNNRPGVTFDGTDDYLSVDSVGSLPVGASPCEIWALAAQNAAAADATSRTMLSYGGTTNAVRRGVGRVVDSGVNRAQVLSNNLPADDTVVDFSGIHVARARITATAEFISVDGGAETTTAVVSATNSTRTRLGAVTSSSPALFWAGALNTLLVVPPLTTQQATDLLAFLKQRGGLS